VQSGIAKLIKSPKIILKETRDRFTQRMSLNTSVHGYLQDRYGRRVDNLRLIVTNRCNYHCIFCHKEGLVSAVNSEERLGPSDYGFLARVLRSVGVKYYKLTGGEPLLRRDVHEIIREIRPHAEEVSVTTNGSLLRDKAKLLAESSVDRLNVSLYSMREDVYKYLTGGAGSLYSVLEGLKVALDYGIKVKLNFLVMKSNAGEILEVLRLAEKYGLDVNVIELIPLGVPINVYTREHVELNSIIKLLEKMAVKKVIRDFQNRSVYVLPSGIRVEVISGYGNPLMCSACTRLRLTPEGFIKTCLYVDKPYVDLYEAITTRNEAGVLEGFMRAISLREPYFKF